jgi:pimeloyl-ACP methyl ester carboxylesterase
MTAFFRGMQNAMNRLEATPFSVPYPGALLRCDSLAAASPLQTLLIHGAGASVRGRFAPLRGVLHAHRIASVAFDCIGHGETGGDLACSSLGSRTRQAEAVLDALPGTGRLAVVGTSMGAYNAIRLLATRHIESLVLVVPGVYTPAAYEIPFGREFSALIRQERSWDQTDAWALLAQFRGRLLVIAAENDDVIPAEIPSRLVQSAVQASWRKLHVVPGAVHNRLFSMLAERPDDFQACMARVLACLQGRD